jgi:hypothetical protein
MVISGRGGQVMRTSAEHVSEIADIEKHIIEHGGSFDSWYVGITDDPYRRLFSEHNVNETFDSWIYRDAHNHQCARDMIRHLVTHLGASGGDERGNSFSRYVYAYRVREHTVQS